MLETEIKKLTAAVEKLTATFEAGRAAPASAPEPAPAAPAPADPPAAKSAAADPWGGASAEAPAAPDEPETPPAAAPAEAVEGFDPNAKTAKKQLTEAFIELAKNKGREVAMTLLSEFNVPDLPSLPQEQWSSFYLALKAKS